MDASAKMPVTRETSSDEAPGGSDTGAASSVWRSRLVLDGLAIAAGAAFAAVVVQPFGSPLTLACAVLWWIAVVAVVRSDLAALIIPDEASVAIAGLGLLYATGAAWQAGTDASGMLLAGAGAAGNGLVAFGLFWFVGYAFHAVCGREGLGFGDTKLAAASAIWLDPGDAAIALEVAALAAVAVLMLRRRKGSVRDLAVPFGAFLAPAGWLVFLVAPMIHAGAADLFP